MLYLSNFGHAICSYRYWHTPEEPVLLSGEATELAEIAPGLAVIQKIHDYFTPRISTEGQNARWEETVRELDALLEDFVEQGYRPEMSAPAGSHQ